MLNMESLKLRSFTALHRYMERVVKKHSLLGDKEFFDPESLSWTKDFEAEKEVICRELNEVLSFSEKLPYVHDITAMDLAEKTQWKALYFFGYTTKSERNCALCPETTHLLEKMPGRLTALFSIVEPGARIPVHRGPYAGVLTYHFALIVPSEPQKCWIRVGGGRKFWRDGKSLLFDDSYPHAVLNGTRERRVVLLVHLLRPLPWLVGLANRIFIRLFMAKTTYVRDAARREREWEADFYR